MSNILIILGSKTGDFSKGDYNRGLFDVAVSTLEKDHDVRTSLIEQGYAVEAEIAKFRKADAIIFQYPVYWFTMPGLLKQYLDDVYAYGEFFEFNEVPYGSGGLMSGRKFMLSTTWNSPTEAFNDVQQFYEGQTPDQALLPMRQTQRYCGMTELSHFSCHDVVKNPNFDVDAVRYQSHLEQQFS